MKQIDIYPDRIRAYGDDDADVFCFVTNTEYVDNFRVIPSPRYRRTMTVPFDGDRGFPDLLGPVIPEGCHIFSIMPNCQFHSVRKEDLGRRKAVYMACRSGRTDLDGIEHFLRAGELTDPAEQEKFAGRFFERAPLADALVLADADYGTEARFRHMDERLVWHDQSGTLEWGQQQVFPAGEIACFIVPLKADALDAGRRFPIDGTLALRGQPIVQSGEVSFLLEDQERIFSRLASMRDRAVIVEVEEGIARQVTATHADCRPAAEMLQALWDVDSRFRRIFEVGFSHNRWVTPWPGNAAMNEVAGGPNGRVHAGFGMLPHSQYHIDIFLAGTRVLGREGEVLWGGDGRAAGPRALRPQRAAACPCLES